MPDECTSCGGNCEDVSGVRCQEPLCTERMCVMGYDGGPSECTTVVAGKTYCPAHGVAASYREKYGPILGPVMRDHAELVRQVQLRADDEEYRRRCHDRNLARWIEAQSQTIKARLTLAAFEAEHKTRECDESVCAREMAKALGVGE